MARHYARCGLGMQRLREPDRVVGPDGRAGPVQGQVHANTVQPQDERKHDRDGRPVQGVLERACQPAAGALMTAICAPAWIGSPSLTDSVSITPVLWAAIS